LTAKEKRPRKFVFVELEERLVDFPVLADYLGIDSENVPDIFKINKAAVDIVLDAVNAIEEPGRRS